jgi:hypothetical protein
MRLGYGKGYYDRFLSEARCPIIALAFDFQVLGENIPVRGHDVKMDSVVTESRVMRFSRFSMKPFFNEAVIQILEVCIAGHVI